MRRLYALSLVALITSALPGCPPPADIGDPNGMVSPVSNEQRAAELDRAQQLIESIPLDGDPAASERIAATLAGMSEFKRVEVYDGNVVAQFADGESILILNNRPNGRQEFEDSSEGVLKSSVNGVAPKPNFAKPPNPSQQSTDGETLSPTSKRAVLVNSMGTAYCDSTPMLGEWLSGAGYDVEHVDATIDALRTKVQDVGVLYMSAHGDNVPVWAVPQGFAQRIEGESDSPLPTIEYPESDFRPHFALWTRTPVTNATINQYRAEITAGDLVYGVAYTDRVSGSDDCADWDGATTLKERRFMITESFVRKHWRCKPGALLYLDACKGASFDSSLPWVCVGTDVGGAVFLGWTATTYDRYSTPSALYFFDRALGANKYPPLYADAQRPFSAGSVLTAMRQVFRLDLPLDSSASPRVSPFAGREAVLRVNSNLVAKYAAGIEDVVLRPAIRNVSVAGEIMRVNGQFGDRPGTVMMNGAPLPLAGVGWTANLIECAVPRTGPGASGEVIVEAEGRTSNPRNLTEWNLTLRRVFMDYPTQEATDCPACFYEATLNYAFRADTGGTRQAPEENVTPPSYIGGASDASIDVTNASGSYFIGQGTTITLSPNPDDRAAFIGTCTGYLPTADNNYLGACYFLQGSQSRIAFSPTISAEGLLRTYTGGAYDGIVDPHQVIYYGNPIGNELILPLSPNFNIMAGNQSTGPNSYFEWDAADAHSPADPSHPK